MAVDRPRVEVAVQMRREAVAGPMARWQPWRWVLAGVQLNEGGFGEVPRMLYQNAQEEAWLYPAMPVELFADDAEGYYLNVATDAPCWFVMWRVEEDCAEPKAVPVAVSLSYHDAGRWLDAQEQVDQVPAPPEVVEWLQAFVAEHHVVEPKRRQRPQSFKPLLDRFGNPASVSTDSKRKGGHG